MDHGRIIENITIKSVHCSELLYGRAEYDDVFRADHPDDDSFCVRR